MLLRHEGLWDVVSPPVPASALPPSAAAQVTGPKNTKSKQGQRASDIIIGFCTPGPLQHILNLESAAERWEWLKFMYGARLSRLPELIEEFVGYAPEWSETGVEQMAGKLTHLQNDIAEVCLEERPSDMMKVAVLVRAAGEVRRSERGEKPRLLMRGKGYWEVVGELMGCEEELRLEAEVMEEVRRAREGRGRSRKNVAGAR